MNMFGDSRKHTTRPIVTGTSVIAIRTDNFVVMAADTLASYGSLARFQNFIRIRSVGDNCLIGCGGEMSDFQAILQQLNDLDAENYCCDDGVKLNAPEVHSYLTRVCYNKRSKMNPLYNQIIIGGKSNNKNNYYLGYCDLYGTTYVDNYSATGMGGHIALPLLRKYYSNNLTLENAKQIIINTMKVLFYRDCRTINRIMIASCDKHGIDISKPFTMDTNWNLKEINPIPKRLQIKEEVEEKEDP